MMRVVGRDEPITDLTFQIGASFVARTSSASLHCSIVHNHIRASVFARFPSFLWCMMNVVGHDVPIVDRIS